MKVLVLGADGFIGRHLVAALELRGHAVLRGARTSTTAQEL
ncbi:MAG: NAD-dependent epimerase/dehydratase family protein, partial [Gammaproteobacteria bacterium]